LTFCAGSYSDVNGSTSCALCSPGSFNSKNGSVSCLPCKPGSYSSKNGSASCELCSPGTHSPVDGSTQCVPCTEGSCASVPGSINCTACSPGTNCRLVTVICHLCFNMPFMLFYHTLIQWPVFQDDWVSWYQNDKPFWILMRQKMMAAIRAKLQLTSHHQNTNSETPSSFIARWHA